MKASETTLRNLLEGTKQFQIPLFQRPYSWTKEKWETLWEDLIKLYSNEVEGSYFLGAIVTQSIPGTADGISPYLVIDGQQRLITLTILLAAMQHTLRSEKNQQFKDKYQKLAGELYDQILTNQYKEGEDFYKVLPTKEDSRNYQSLLKLKKDKNEVKKEGEGRINEAYKFFQKRLKEPILEEEIALDLAKFKTVILERLLLVNITSDEQDNPYLIFESLNYKGQELSQADLVRNYIFMRLPHERREEIYRNKWLPLQEEFKANMRQKEKEYADELTTAFWFYLRKDGEPVIEKGVYKAIKNRFDTTTPNEMESKLEELVQFANYYQRLKFYDKEPEVKLRRWFDRLLRLDFTTCHIFLLNVYDEYAQQKLSLKEFETILRYLESYFVRRWFADVSTRSLGNVFNNLYREVKATNPNNLVDGLRTVLIGYEKAKIWPSDEEFREKFVTKSVYSSTNINRVQFILESLNVSLSKEKVDPQNLTIEHIMPQKLNSQWKAMLEQNSNQVYKELLHTLGNLTLTAYNGELGNKPFDEKKSIYLQSNVSLNRYFQNITHWNAEEIKHRADKLADIAIQVWPR
ncbi:DUF262 domain-containing protein [Planktothrix agardhii]|jgi:uncharacterized protein with ParB-like and HNH nuclease domain|uniref:DUF262 domain-containing protein n=2 Tax=Planktothrix TaxID=54304 RepID=UPI000DBB1067|nr:DUF262 domain-containing protein [Planktothrix agardhii]MCB8749275.1 DUF262 domain-containing HNH endonuclease family protein [Planktothrix agardhii 1810]MCF3605300.1 DUF262 domain-containing HNH endonuclease family protein [Planktothrix agardhii 1033]BBD54015.1 hypothetical protein NIES204_12990 [Planktothrix agardhii NIES-204]